MHMLFWLSLAAIVAGALAFSGIMRWAPRSLDWTAWDLACVGSLCAIALGALGMLVSAVAA